MIVTKVRGQNKVGKILLSRAETAVVQKMGLAVEEYVKQQLILIAKRRKWKWYLEANT